MQFINLKAQYQQLKENINKRIQSVLDHGQYILGPEVQELEDKLASYVDSKYCITVASGTEALLISLLSIEIKPGDEIITTPFTFVATSEVIALLGAKPVFVDIEADTCNIAASKIEKAITNKTKAIMPVSLYGQPADMDEINVIAAKYDLPVIDDAAQSFGATYNGRKSCSLTTISCTSFFPSKPLGCYGDGGAIFTDDEALAQKCREIRVHGQKKRYVHTMVGVGGRMDTIQCAIVLAKLERFDWEVKRRIELGNRYNEAIDKIGIKRVQQRLDRTSVFAQYTIFVDDREHIQDNLKAAEIPTAIHYPVPLDKQPAYMQYAVSGATPIASDIANQVLSLPMSAYLEDHEQQKILETLEYL